jgi:hypothetical protein
LEVKRGERGVEGDDGERMESRGSSYAIFVDIVIFNDMMKVLEVKI